MRQALAGLALLGLLLCPVRAAEGGYADVPQGAWYVPYLDTVTQAGVMNGTGGGGFTPQGTVTGGELFAIQMRLTHLLREKAPLGPAPAWYWAEESVDRAKAREVLPGWLIDAYYYYVQSTVRAPVSPQSAFGKGRLAYWQEPATRTMLADALAEVLPMAAAINDVAFLPDTGDPDALMLCRAGILTGVDGYGTFHGEGTLTRAELTAAAARVLDPALRARYDPEPWPGWEGFTLSPIPVPRDWTAEPWNGGDYLACSRYVKIRSTDPDRLTGYGVLDREGTYILPDVYAYIWGFDERGISRVSSFDTPTSYVDTQGRTYGQEAAPTAPQSFSETDYRQGPYGYKAPDGSVLAPAVYDWVFPFSEGLGAVVKDGRVGFLDESGQVVLSPRFPIPDWEKLSTVVGQMYRFQEGLAVVMTGEREGQPLWGAVDRTGALVTPADFLFLDPPSDGMLPCGRLCGDRMVFGYYDCQAGRDVPILWGGARQ